MAEKKKNMPLGGLVVVIVGDMYQVPPVDRTAFDTSVADLYVRNKKFTLPPQPVSNTL